MSTNNTGKTQQQIHRGMNAAATQCRWICPQFSAATSVVICEQPTKHGASGGAWNNVTWIKSLKCVDFLKIHMQVKLTSGQGWESEARCTTKTTRRADTVSSKRLKLLEAGAVSAEKPGLDRLQWWGLHPGWTLQQEAAILLLSAVRLLVFLH